MRYYRRLLLGFLLGISLVLSLLLPLQAQPVTTPDPLQTPISALRLNPQQLAASLDAGNISEAIQQLERGWRQQLNEYYGRLFRTSIPSPEQIAQQLRQNAEITGQQSALIYAVPAPNQLEVILLLPDGTLTHHRVSDAPADIMAETIREFRIGLTTVNSPSSRYLPAAQKLFQWLIEPLESELEAQGVDKLIFCLGGQLRGIPMAALHDGQRFLVEKYGLAFIPAFNLLDPEPPDLSNAQVLAMGASEFQSQLPLPAVPLELAAINRLWQGDVSLNQAFTLDNLLELRSREPYPILHLATHANFAAGSVRESYIQFWDQQLRLDQVRHMGLRTPPVELLVLSACQTALGDPNAELGFAGLAVQSGAKSALASLWFVSDVGTFLFMTGFYENLMTAPTKGDAIQQTQQAMLRGELTLNSDGVQQAMRGESLPPEISNAARVDFSHPYYWAGFTMIGNPW